MYPDDATQVYAITANLDKSASEWLVLLHNEDTLELIDLNAFMQSLGEFFKDTLQPIVHPGPKAGKMAGDGVCPRLLFSHLGD